MINMSNIVTTDIVASNGIIHVIDTVLDAPSVEACATSRNAFGEWWFLNIVWLD